MKIRTGFVSNSLSSNFIVIGKRFPGILEKGKAQELITKGRLYACNYDDYDEGVDFFQMTQDMFDLYIKHLYEESHIGLSFYDIDKLICENGVINKKDIKDDKFPIFYLEITAHRTETVKEFTEKYLPEPKHVKMKRQLDGINVKIKKLQDEAQEIIDDSGVEMEK